MFFMRASPDEIIHEAAEKRLKDCNLDRRLLKDVPERVCALNSSLLN